MINCNEIKGIIFDLDDTLVDSNKAQKNAICEFKRMFQVFDKENDEIFIKIWEYVTEEAYNKYLNNELTFREMRIERMQKIFLNYSVEITMEEAEEKFERYLEAYERNWVLFDDAEEILDYLKNKYKLAIISNGDTDQQKRKIQFTGLDKYFQDIVISSEVGYSKPQKEIFEIACKRINLEPEKCIMVGDKYKVDIEGSINTGMKGIWVNRKKEQLSYEYQIEELNELTKYL